MNFFKILTLVIISSVLSHTAFGAEYLPISRSIFSNSALPFLSHRGEGPFDTTLAMNIQYAPIKRTRDDLSDVLNYNLDFFKLWNSEGEAHITVITPPEYFGIIKNFVSIDRIEQIAVHSNIQYSDLTILGLGRGTASLNGKVEETYFFIVQSQNLIKIRQAIYNEYLKNGGPANAWSPEHFYPHITIGYSLRDLHEADGILKDITHSLDSRFQLFFTQDD